MMSEILIANSSGAVVGTHSVAARVSVVQRLGTAARGNLGWVAVGAFLSFAILALQQFDDEEVNKAIKDWGDAARFLGGDQFGAALAEVMPADDEWDFDDRDAFESFIRKLNAEIDSLAQAFAANQETLAAARDAFHEAIDGLVAALVPILLAVIAAIVLQAFPPTMPLAQAIGIAGMTATVAVVALTYGELAALFSAASAAVRGNSRFAFVADSRPGWAGAGADPQIADIRIDWVKDPAFYRK